MNILLIQAAIPHTEGWYAHYPPLGLLLLGTIAKRGGCDVALYDYQLAWDQRTGIPLSPLALHVVADRVPQLSPLVTQARADLIGIGYTTAAAKQAGWWAAQCRKIWPEARLVAGGPDASARPGEAKAMGFDQVIVGRGELAWAELLGLDSSKVDLNPPLDYSLASLPDEDWPYCGAAPERRPSYQVMTAYGCPYRCAFCAGARQPLRMLSAQDAAARIELLVWSRKAAEVFITDDTFNTDPGRASAILSRLAVLHRLTGVVFRLAMRPETRLVPDELLRMAKRAGVWRIFYGVESGSQRVLDSVQKGTRLPEIADVVERTHRAGITTDCAFIAGLPEDDDETLEESLHFAESLHTYLGCCFATPFPGTDLWDIAWGEGLWDGEFDTDRLTLSEPVVRTRHISAERVREWRDRIQAVAFAEAAG